MAKSLKEKEANSHYLKKREYDLGVIKQQTMDWLKYLIDGGKLTTKSEIDKALLLCCIDEHRSILFYHNYGKKLVNELIKLVVFYIVSNNSYRFEESYTIMVNNMRSLQIRGVSEFLPDFRDMNCVKKLYALLLTL